MTVIYIAATILAAVYLTSGNCMPTQNIWAVPWLPLRWWHCPRCPHQKSPVAPNFLICRGCPALWTLGQPEEDWGPSPACTPRRVLPFPHQYWWNWTESSSPVPISGLYLHIRYQDRQGSRQQAKANSTFSRLYKRVWNNKHLKKGTKISIYQAVILTTLLYGSESWVTYHYYLRLLERFHQCCFRTILKIHWNKYVSNVEVLDQAEIISKEAMLLKSQLQWAGHVSRIRGHRLPKIAQYSKLSTGYHDRGAPKKHFKDSLKKTCNTYVFVYIYIYMYVWTCIYVCIYIYNMYTFVYIYIYIYTFVCIYVYVCVYIYMCVCVCVRCILTLDQAIRDFSACGASV